MTFDQWLLLKINRDWANLFFDWFFPVLTNWHKTDFFKFIFVPAIFVLLVWKLKKSGALLFVLLIGSLGLGDFIASQWIKPWIHRLRPPEAGVDVILRSPHFGILSFPSGHATNMFCAATFLGFCFPRARWFFYLFAFLVAYSRPYVGVHYPMDVVAGAAFGSLVGYLGFLLFQKIHGKIFQKEFA